MTKLVIDAPHFFAALILEQSPAYDIKARKAAPIIEYMIGWTLDDVLVYCDKKGWKVIE